MKDWRWIVGICILAILGCDWREDSKTRAARERERVARISLKESMEKTLELTRSMVFTRVTPIADGGSWVYFFTAESGTKVHLLALHHRKDFGGSEKYQVIRLLSTSGNIECDVPEGSKLKSQLIRLIKTATIADDMDPNDLQKPTQMQLQWLIVRMTNRSVPWDSPRTPQR